MLIGNKLDMILTGEAQRAVDKEDIEEFCNQYDLQYFETSAKTGENIIFSFTSLIKSIFNMGPDNPGNVPIGSNGMSLSAHLHRNKNRGKKSDGDCC